MNPIIAELENQYKKENIPDMNPGDTVKVFVRIVEGNKERIQAFEGTVIKEHGAGINKTITVRKVFQGIGVERVFLLNSPRIDKITVLRRGDVRRSKLYYLRERSGKATRIREKIEKDTVVKIVRIEGVKLVVRPINKQEAEEEEVNNKK